MTQSQQVTMSVPQRLFELGLPSDPAQLQSLAMRAFVISLFEQEKISPAQAAEILTIDQDSFLQLVASSYPAQDGTGASVSEDAKLKAELAQTRRELAEVEDELHHAQRTQSDFIATVSHELRTPLNSIIGFTKLLLNQKIGPLNELQNTDLSLIYESAQHLLGLVNDILDLSKIEAGKIRLYMDYVSVEEIVVGVIASTYILIGDKPIELVEEIEPHLPKLYVDRGRIRQVVINLLSNAAKFTNSGNITMRVYRLNKEGQDCVCFAIKDTGIGISPEDREEIFEPFRQVDSSEARQAEGTGLGLPISYRLIKLHGGQLWADSIPGRGSTFYVTIPIEPPQTPRPEVVHAEYGLK